MTHHALLSRWANSRRLNGRTLIVAAALAIDLSTAGTTGAKAANELVVLDAVGAALKPGARVDAAQPLVLTAGQQVTLIAANGSLIRLKGPHAAAPGASAGTAGSDGARLAQSLQAFVGANAASTAKMGAIRQGGGEPASGPVGAAPPPGSFGGVIADEPILPDPWVIDVSRPGNRCARAGEVPVLWRPDRTGAPRVSLGRADGGWSAHTVWPDGYNRLAAPDALLPQGGSRYRIAIGGPPVEVELHWIPAGVPNGPVLAAWMVEKGCTAQARTLLAGLAQE